MSDVQVVCALYLCQTSQLPVVKFLPFLSPCEFDELIIEDFLSAVLVLIILLHSGLLWQVAFEWMHEASLKRSVLLLNYMKKLLHVLLFYYSEKWGSLGS